MSTVTITHEEAKRLVVQKLTTAGLTTIHAEKRKGCHMVVGIIIKKLIKRLIKPL
jgi:hypothetical protein